MTLQDWSWIIGFLAVAFALAVWHARRSGRSVEDYFVADRKAPWWVLGTSIVATTFAADTPLVVCSLVIVEGVPGNWLWWAVVPSGMLGVFFFAQLWRRSGCLTQAELVTIRYGPRRAPVLRLFYVFYHGVLRNAVTLGFVNLAMAKIIALTTPLEQWHALLGCFVLTVLYTTLGGINGVMWTDLVQFCLAVGTSIAVAYFAVARVDGSDPIFGGLVPPLDQYGNLRSFGRALEVSFLPQWGTRASEAFLILITIYWVACTPTDGNGYAVQRLLSARDERHAVWGYLWFNCAHYVLRPWPWIIVGLVALLHVDDLYPSVTASDPDYERAYLRVLLGTAPPWLIGPALASIVAAYMSTVDTHLNWSASYVINDFYRPYVRPGASDRHYVRASHCATVLVAIAGVGATYAMSSIVEGWGLIYGLLAGMGVIGILRWLWWRITAWSELGCMLGAGVATLATHYGIDDLPFPFNLTIIVPIALVGAVIGTFAFAAEPQEVLVRFARRVRPPGPGWRRVLGHPGERAMSLWRPTVCWLLGTAAIYCGMFGIGSMLLRSLVSGVVLCTVAVAIAILAGAISAKLAGGPFRDIAPDGERNIMD